MGRIDKVIAGQLPLWNSRYHKADAIWSMPLPEPFYHLRIRPSGNKHGYTIELEIGLPEKFAA